MKTIYHYVISGVLEDNGGFQTIPDRMRVQENVISGKYTLEKTGSAKKDFGEGIEH